jgi:hypothetical protein
MAGSNSTIGNAAGELIASFTAAGDSGPLMYYVSPPGNWPINYSLIRTRKEFTIGLGGSGAGLMVTMYFTTDRDTAAGVSANPVWFLCPSPSTESSSQWSNPMTNIVGQNVLNFKANAIALRAVATPIVGGPAISGSTNVILMA